MASPLEMYGKILKPCISLTVHPIKALLLSSSLAFDGLHEHIKILALGHCYQRLLTKNGLQGEREPTILKVLNLHLSN